MIRRLARCVREYRRLSLLTPLLVTLEVVVEIAIPLLMADLIDYGIDAGNMSYIAATGGKLLLLALLMLLFGALAGKTAAAASAGFAKNLRHDMYYRVQEFSFSNIDKFSTGSIVTRLTTDVSNIQLAFQMLIRGAVRSPIMIVVSLIVAFGISAKLSMIFIAVMPLLVGGLLWIISRVHPIFDHVFKVYDNLNNMVSENLRGVRVVKSFVRESYQTDRFREISGGIHDDFSRGEKLIAFNMPLMQSCMYLCMLLISWFGARIVVSTGGIPETGLSTGELMSLISYITQILMSLMMISMMFAMFTVSRASAERIVELLEETSDLVSPGGALTEVKSGEIVFDNVSFSYNKGAEKPCLRNASLRIAPGETVGIIGGTGSSKSTLVQLIPRLYDVTAGSVSVGGADVRRYDLDALRDQVSMVLQKNVLFSGTIRENLRWGDENASDEELVHACKIAAAHDFIESFPDGYDTVLEQGGTNVSGGQKQRLCIARALLKKPKVIIFDDSTSAVDTKTDAQIRAALRSELPGTTKLIIAQRISSVQDADRIVVMDDGVISAVGTHDELLNSSDIYREVWESQMGGLSE